MPHTSTKNPHATAHAVQDSLEFATAIAVTRARKRIREGYYDRPEVRRTLAALILRHAVRNGLNANPSRPKTP